MSDTKSPLSRITHLLAGVGVLLGARFAEAQSVDLGENPPASPPARPCAIERFGGGAKPYSASMAGGVYLHSGEFTTTAVDLRIPGRGMAFVWAQKYRSRIGPDTVQGNGWDFSYNISLEADGPDRIVNDGNTRADRYTPDRSDTWSADGFFRSLVQDPDEGYRLIFPDTGQWHFNALNDSPTAGKISRIEDREGNTFQFEYDATGRLSQVTDTLSRPITVNYNPAGFIESITDFAGRQVAYEYYQDGDSDGSAGDLKSVTTPAVVEGDPNFPIPEGLGHEYPGGKTTVYSYTTGFADDALNHNLLTITDPKGQTYLTNTYSTTLDPGALDFDRCIRQAIGDPDDVIDYVYVEVLPTLDNNFAVLETLVNERVGHVQECFYNDQNLLVIKHQLTGRADPDLPTTPDDNRPTDKLRPDDPDFFETRFDYNIDALMTRVDLPRGNSVEYVYERDIEPAAEVRSRGNLREVHLNPGNFGGNQPSIDVFRTYESGFNFMLASTDARGNVTSYTYDPLNGNLIETVGRISTVVHNYEYNQFGQVTARIWPEHEGQRRRDEFTYYDDPEDSQNGYLHERIVDADNLALTSCVTYDIVGNIISDTDPKGQTTEYVRNALNQIVRLKSRPVDTPSGVVQYVRDTYYDANNNVARVDVENVDDQGMAQDTPKRFSTITEFEVLNYPVRTCRASGTFDVPLGQLNCDDLPEDQFVTTEYEYTDNRLLTLVRYPEAVEVRQPTNTLSVLYDERDLTFQTIRAEGDPDQSTTQVDYDLNGNLIRTTVGLEDPNRHAYTRTFDGYDRTTMLDDPMGNRRELHYNENSFVVSTLVHGELTDVAGDDGNVRLGESSTVYDALDRPTQRIVEHFDPAMQLPIGDGKSITIFEYSDASLLTRVEDDNAHQTLFDYDTAWRRNMVTDHKANTSESTYDLNSNVIAITETDLSDLRNPTEVFVSTISRDGLDRVISTTDNIGNTMQYGYDSRSNRTQTVDALLIETRRIVDGLSRTVMTVRDMDGDGADSLDEADIVLASEWDDSSRLIRRIDDNENRTSWTYDALNRRTITGRPDGTLHTVVYDVFSNPVLTIDANDTLVDCAFDLSNRLISKIITPGPGVSPETTFETYEYDGRSLLVRGEDDDSIVQRTYDSMVNLTSETLTIAAGRTDEVIGRTTYGHDGVGNVLQLGYPGGRFIDYEHDELNRVKTISDVGQLISEYFYIGRDRVEQREYGNNTRLTVDYDGARRVVGTSHVFDPGGSATIFDDRSYAYDAMYNKIQRADVRADGPQIIHDYTYDDAYRLANTTVTDPGTLVLRDTDYALDGMGNRVTVTGSPDSGDYVGDYVRDDTFPVPADFQMDQYTEIPGELRSYDCNGNLTSFAPASPCDPPALCDGDVNGDGAVDPLDAGAILARFGLPVPPNGCWDVNGDGDINPLDSGYVLARFGLCDPPPGGASTLMSYSYRNQMVEYDDTATGEVTTYAYDVFGRRIAKLDTDNTSLRYFYDARGRVIEETDEHGTTHATWDVGDETYPHKVDSDGDSIRMQRGGVDYYYATDGLGNVMAMTDTGGTVQERYEYGDYGQPLDPETLEPAGPSAIDNPYRFKGLRFDPETAFYRLDGSATESAYLDPTAGRFTSRSPAGPSVPASHGNAYTAFGSNPWSGQPQTSPDYWWGGYAGERYARGNPPGGDLRSIDIASPSPYIPGGSVVSAAATGVGGLRAPGSGSAPDNRQFTMLSNVMKTEHDRHRPHLSEPDYSAQPPSYMGQGTHTARSNLATGDIALLESAFTLTHSPSANNTGELYFWPKPADPTPAAVTSDVWTLGNYAYLETFGPSQSGDVDRPITMGSVANDGQDAIQYLEMLYKYDAMTDSAGAPSFLRVGMNSSSPPPFAARRVGHPAAEVTGSITWLDPTLSDSTGGIYINIHTVQHPGAWSDLLLFSQGVGTANLDGVAGGVVRGSSHFVRFPF